MPRIQYRYIVAAIYTVVLFLDRLDLTIVNIALPAIAQHFQVLVTSTEWVSNTFLLALAVSIPVSPWLSDNFGSKRIFIIALLIFGTSSLCCAFAPNLSFLICMRFIQGLSSGLLVPIGMSMVFRVFPSSEYASISSYIFMPSLIAPALSPMLGGIMIDYFDWRWVFLFVTPLCVLIAILSYWLLKEQKCENKLPLDSRGFVLAVSTLLLIFHALSAVGSQGFTWMLLSELMFAVVLGYLFIRREKSSPAPLLHLNLFKNKLFVQANLIQALFQIGHFGSIFIIAIYLQMCVGYSAMLAGSIMGMQALGAICSSRLSVYLYQQHTAKLPISIGLVGVGIITPFILSLHSDTPIVFGLIILFTRGLLSGLCGAPIQAMGITGFGKEQISQATAAFNIGRQLSISLGIALSALLLNTATHGDAASTLMHQDKSVFYASFALISLSVFSGAWIAMILNKTLLTIQHQD